MQKFSFHARNRILAGLCEGVLVISAATRSGALTTANSAADYGREVFAFPYSPGSAQGEGCNELIKRGAYLVTETKDIFDCYGIIPAEKKRTPLSPEEQKVIGVLKKGEETHASALAATLGMQVHEVTALLSALELKGLAIKGGGNRYKSI